MDSHTFTHAGGKYVAKSGKIWIHRDSHEESEQAGADALSTRLLRAACAEIMKLVAERDNWKRSAEWDSEQRDLANEALNDAESENAKLAKKLKKVRDQRAELVDQVTALTEENHGLRMTVEEGSEIERELSIALAILAGETLKPCVGDCPGHLRENAYAAYRAALDAWHALQEGNQKLMADYATVVLERDRLRQEVALLRPGTVHPDAQDARLGRELAEILQRQGGGVIGESYPHLLRRIIRERAEGRTFRMHWQQANDTANRLARRVVAVEAENRTKCLELAEKAGDRDTAARELLFLAGLEGISTLSRGGKGCVFRALAALRPDIGKEWEDDADPFALFHKYFPSDDHDPEEKHP